jgi:RNase P/RNase MRP subunit p30
MRNPREFVSLINVLGLDIGKAFASTTSTPQSIVEGNKKTLEGDKITEGVEVE